MADSILFATFVVEANAGHLDKIGQILQDGATSQGYSYEEITVEKESFNVELAVKLVKE